MHCSVSISRESSRNSLTSSSSVSSVESKQLALNDNTNLPSAASKLKQETISSQHVSPASSVVSSKSTTGRRHRADTANIKEYGVCYKRLGEGSTAIVMITRKGDKVYAIKQFRKQKRTESEKDYMKKLTSEFCISSTFSHPNIVETIDLVLDDKKRYSTVMEYCPGGDLFGCIMSGCMTEREKACCFKQMMQGVAYLHSVGVAHRDIKPENLLLAADGTVKITDFGVSDVFRFVWESQCHKSRGLMGSEPYIAPEAFEQKEYWGAAIDIWSTGIVLYCLWMEGLVWHRAKKTEAAFASYVRTRSKQQFDLFSKLPAEPRRLVYAILDPNPATRPTAEDVLNDPWVQSIDVCQHGIGASGERHRHLPASCKV
ncbi:kinase-like protein [Hesseltinella vesiculosa]|uniref:non-specific serine/threonine protein kinase n=1 Tax=Hesseltinella vesiculosa TaxID=101127 RepID=A0A1X2GRL0_9FUNG|nr:kinase-like protein [Hesseltinella vesiculosa]